MLTEAQGVANEKPSDVANGRNYEGLTVRVNEERFSDLAVGLLRLRVRLAHIALDLERVETVPVDDDTPKTSSPPRAGLEDLLAKHFDPLVRAVLIEAGGPRAALLEVVLDLVALKTRLHSTARDLPRSPDEDAMLEGDLTPDLFTEIRTTVNAVSGDQFDLAIDNLLCAAGYKQPGPQSQE